MANRLECLKNDENVMRSDIICLQEISYDWGPIPAIPGYQYYSSGHGPKRGVAVFIKNILHACLENVIQRDEQFAQFLLLSFSAFNVITVYRTHLCKRAHFEKQFIESLFHLIDGDKPTIINGDFNFEYWDEQETLLTHSLKYAGFIQIVSEPTTVRGNCIDHFYLPRNEANFDYKLYYPYYADHEAIMVMIKGWKQKPTRTQIRKQLKRENKTKI